MAGFTRRNPVSWLSAYSAVLCVLSWARTLRSAFLLVAAVSAAIAGWTAWRAWNDRTASDGAFKAGATPEPARRRASVFLAGIVCLAAAVALGVWTERRLAEVATRWDGIVAARDAALSQELRERMGQVVERGLRAAADAARLPLDAGEPAQFEHLANVLARSGVEALAVLDDRGQIVAWAGEHRGTVPDVVHMDAPPVVYVERPLFSYLYFSAPVEGRADWRAIAAVLLQTEPALADGGADSFADRFAATTGSRPHFMLNAGEGATWLLSHEAEPVVYARFDTSTQAETRAAIAEAGARGATLFGLAALGLLGLAWLRAGRWHRRRASAVPLVATAVVLPVAPIGAALRIQPIFSPALFMLPSPRELTLGTLLSIVLPLAALVSTRRTRLRRLVPARFRIGVAAIAVGFGFAFGLRWLVSAAAPPLLQSATYLWGALFPAVTLVLTLFAAACLPMARSLGSGVVRRLPVYGGLVLSAVLSFATMIRWEARLAIPHWMPALWGVPFALLAVGFAEYRGRAGLLARWLAAGWLAGSAVVPYLWASHMDARLRAAEREIATLGARPDPYLDYLLRNFASEVTERSARGESGVELLYRAWLASNMARDGYPAHIALWNADGNREVELALGGGGLADRRSEPPRWALLEPVLARAREAGQPVVEAADNIPGANHLLAVPLSDGRLVAVVVPPRRSLERTTVLAPFLSAAPRTDIDLTLVPDVIGGDVDAGAIRWRPSETGWRSEALVRYPEGEYHAHVELRTPSLWVLLARGALLLGCALAGLVLIWFAGRAARGDPPAPVGGWRNWLGGFRARVTLALFAFFLMPTALFGWIAHRGFAGEVTRSARAMAERAVIQAVSAFPDDEQNLGVLAGRIGEEVLHYQRGELVLASSPEAVALGLYGAWMPPSVYLALATGEQLSVVETQELVRHPYLVAYRRLPAAGVLAVPVSLRTGEAAVRQAELTHLMLFAAMIGALLSLALSVAVGRALADPIGQLRRAYAAVGAGRLRIRLPEERTDEFGELFAAFNRMTRRLRRARAQEIRTARVLAWGEMARQIAHEIKNPLTPIKLSVQHLRRAFRDRRPDFDEVLESNVEHILAEIDRLSEVARAFSRYASPTDVSGPPEPTSVGHVVREVLALYRGGDAAVAYDGAVPTDLPLALARPGELKEVLFNVIENARAASDGGGRITVSAVASQSHIDLVVADEGHGIEPELLDRIFEPHFSTRSTGTGLGLAIVRRLVEGWGGTVRVESRVGEGTRLTIRMRRADSAVAAGPD